MKSTLDDTVISDLPFAKTADNLFSSMFDFIYQINAGEKFINYRGEKLYVDTSKMAGEAVDRGNPEPDLRKNIIKELDKGDFAIDIGAHMGYFTLVMKKAVSNEGTVWAFEPYPENISMLKKSKDKNCWKSVEIFDIALADKKKTEQLAIPDDYVTGKAGLMGSNKKLNAKTGDQSLTVECRSLTKIMKEHNIKNVDLIKIDVEGSEVDIIKDIESQLDKIQVILLELHCYKLEDYKVRETYDILADNGVIMNLNRDRISLNSVPQDDKIRILWKQNEPT